MWHSSVRRLPVLAAGLAACLTAAVGTAGSAAAEPATITVTVVGADTGQPLATGVCVDAYSVSDGTVAATDCTDSQTGVHTLDGLQALAEYKIRITAGLPYPAETWLPGGPTTLEAQPVAAPATVEEALPLAGTLTGTLTRSDGQAAAGVPVVMFDANLEYQCCGQATTAADGTWTITGLFPAQYKVKFDDCCPAVWAFGKGDWFSADTLTVPAGGTTTADDTLPVRTSISGTITDAWTGAPVEGVCITLVSVDPTAGGGWSGGCSDPSGKYVANDVTPGDYQVQFIDSQGRYAAEYYDNASDRASAKIITVSSGGQVTGIDAALTPAAVITGRAVDATTRKPIASVCPYAYAGRSGPQIEVQHGECSQDDGLWRVSGLPAGATTVYLRPLVDYLPTWAYSSSTQAKAAVFTLQAGTTTRLRDVKLSLGGTLTGVVTDARTGTPVSGAWVTTDPFNPRDDPFYLIHVAQTDATGHYTIKQLAGDYTPLTFDQQGVYGFEWSGNADSQATATPITVRAGRTTTYNVALDPAAILTGQIIGASGAVSSSTGLVDVFTATGDQVGWTSDVRPDGTFTVTGLPGGDVAVRLASPNLDGTVVWHDGVPSRAAATLVATTSGATSSIVTHVPWD
jgi:hypothetical protein